MLSLCRQSDRRVDEQTDGRTDGLTFIPLQSDAIIMIRVHDLLGHDMCRCVLIRASRADALCCDVLRLLDGYLSDFNNDLATMRPRLVYQQPESFKITEIYDVRFTLLL